MRGAGRSRRRSAWRFGGAFASSRVAVRRLRAAEHRGRLSFVAGFVSSLQFGVRHGYQVFELLLAVLDEHLSVLGSAEGGGEDREY